MPYHRAAQVVSNFQPSTVGVGMPSWGERLGLNRSFYHNLVEQGPQSAPTRQSPSAAGGQSPTDSGPVGGQRSGDADRAGTPQPSLRGERAQPTPSVTKRYPIFNRNKGLGVRDAVYPKTGVRTPSLAQARMSESGKERSE